MLKVFLLRIKYYLLDFTERDCQDAIEDTWNKIYCKVIAAIEAANEMQLKDKQ